MKSLKISPSTINTPWGRICNVTPCKVSSIYRANKTSQKKEYLECFLDMFEWLKLEIRLCVDLKIVSFKKQAVLTVLMDSIGKQVTGWRNASQ